jgi:hypothetical protein
LFKADQVKENEVGRACGTCGRIEKSVQGFGVKPEGKRPQGRPSCRREGGIIIIIIIVVVIIIHRHL